MPKQSWERVDELFHQVIELEPDHRAAFLQESVSDPQIRKEVESLLAYEQRSANFIEDRALLACELLAACEVPTPESNADTRVSCEEATPDPLVGTTVSRFRIIEKLGSGGMGLVYRAEDLELGRQVALKFLKRPGSDWVSEAERNSLERLYLEARASSALDHANICTIFEVDQHEGRPFLVMQLLVGRSLKQEVAGGPLSVDRVMKFGIQCASALVTAHGAGIVHRDIKSANIFLTQRQEVKILDFGLAQSERLQANGQPEHQRDARAQLSGEDSLAHTLAAFGTAAYMSPQQILGEHLDGRADVFSLGVVLYEMATGQLPFQGENTADVLANVLQVVPPSASILNPSVPGQLASVIGRCLDKGLERRYQSAAELREALLRVQSELPGVSGSWSRKSFRLLLVLTAVACALAFRPRSSSLCIEADRATCRSLGVMLLSSPISATARERLSSMRR